MNKRYYAGALIALALACAPAPEASSERSETDRDAAREAVSMLRDAYTAAAEAGDASAITALYAENAILLPATGGRYEGHEQIQASYQATFSQGDVTFRAEPRSFELDGNIAMEDGVATFSVTPDGGETRQVQAEYLVVSREVDGEWKILRLQSKAIVPPTDTP